MTDRVVVGRCGAAHGVQGWLQVQSFTDPAENLIGYSPWQVQTHDGWVPASVAAWRPHARGFVVHLTGIDDRSAAERLRGCMIGIDAAQLPPAGADEYYWKDLIGLAVVDTVGRVLGEVTGLVNTQAHDILQVRPPAGGPAGELLIPFVRRVVVDVDLAARRIVADWDPDF